MKLHLWLCLLLPVKKQSQKSSLTEFRDTPCFRVTGSLHPAKCICWRFRRDVTIFADDKSAGIPSDLRWIPQTRDSLC